MNDDIFDDSLLCESQSREYEHEQANKQRRTTATKPGNVRLRYGLDVINASNGRTLNELKFGNANYKGLLL